MQRETCCTDPRRCGLLPAAPTVESVTVGRKRRLWRDRKGMTLVEILIAIGILALGTMGVASLFYLGVRNSSVSWHRRTAAAVAKNAITSLRSYSLDLTELPEYGSLDVNGNDLYDAGIDIPLQGWAESFLSDALAHYNDTSDIGHGYYYDTFQIPRDVLLPASLAGQWQGTTAYVSCPWNLDYGWTATIWPTPIDDDGDDALYGTDEDPLGDADGDLDPDDDGDGQVDEDGPNVSRDTIFQVQVAAWRKYRLIENVGAVVTATFQHGSQTVSVAGASADFWNKVKVGDWIRHRRSGIWYRIIDTDSLTDEVLLAQPFSHPFAAALTGPVDLANRFHLISVYDATIGR